LAPIRGLNDVRGFGRRWNPADAKEVEYLVTYQVGALQALASAQEARVHYVKPHGVLNNIAREERDVADAIARGISAADRELVFVATVSRK